MFTNGPGDQGSIPGQVIPKTQKIVLDATLLSTIRWGSWVKWSNLRNGVVPSPTPPCSSYWKGSLRVTLDYGHQLYFYMYVFTQLPFHKQNVTQGQFLSGVKLIWIQFSFSLTVSLTKAKEPSLPFYLAIAGVRADVWRYPLGPHVTSTSLNHFTSWPGDQLVVPIGASHISSWLQEIQSREWEKKNKRTNKQYKLGLTQSARRGVM